MQTEKTTMQKKFRVITVTLYVYKVKTIMDCVYIVGTRMPEIWIAEVRFERHKKRTIILCSYASFTRTLHCSVRNKTEKIQCVQNNYKQHVPTAWRVCSVNNNEITDRKTERRICFFSKSTILQRVVTTINIYRISRKTIGVLVVCGLRRIPLITQCNTIFYRITIILFHCILF